MPYNALTGDDYTLGEALGAWSSSMGRNAPAWQLRGEPSAWYWTFFNFRSWTGRVTVEADGFHWSTLDYATGTEIHSGVTTSLYVAYQSVTRNAPASVPACTVCGRAVQLLYPRNVYIHADGLPADHEPAPAGR